MRKQNNNWYIQSLKSTYLLVILGLSVFSDSFGQVTPPPTIFSVTSGNWSDGLTWNTGIVPGAADDVEIRNSVSGNVDATVNSISINNSTSASRLIIETGVTIRVGELTNYAISILGVGSNDLRLNVMTGGSLLTDGPMLFYRACNCSNSIRATTDPGGTITTGSILAYYNNGGFSEITDELSFAGNSITNGDIVLQYDNLNGDSNLYAEIIGNGTWTVNGNLYMDPIAAGNNQGDIYVQVGNLVSDAASMHITGDLVMNLDNSGSRDPDDINLELHGSSQLIVDGDIQMIHDSNSSNERIRLEVYDNSFLSVSNVLLSSTTNTGNVNNLFRLHNDTQALITGDLNLVTSFGSGGSARRVNHVELDDNSVLELQGNVNSTNQGRLYFGGNNSTAWIYLTGNIQQTIPNIYNGAGTTGNLNTEYNGVYGNLLINNTSGSLVLMESPVVIRGALNLVEGIVDTNTYPFTFSSTSTTNIGDFDAFINGPVYKEGSQDMQLPLGDVAWGPIGIESYSGADATTRIQVQYHNSTPPDNTNVDTGVDHISGVEYWSIAVVAGTEPSQITSRLYWEDACASGIEDLTSGELFLVRYDGNSVSPIWTDNNTSSQSIAGGSEACDLLDGDNEIGNLSAVVTSLTDLTMVTFGALSTLNALPVELTHFTGSLSNSGVRLRWETASEVNVEQFIVEKLANGVSSFTPIGSLNASGANSGSTYYFDDDSPIEIAYYRLTIKDLDGTYRYSNIVNITNEEFGKFYAFPNPGSNELINLNKRCRILNIYNSLGQLEKQLRNVSSLDAIMLKPGAYYLRNEQGLTFRLVIK